MDSFAPIVLFVYSRPDHTKKVIDGLLENPESKDSILYIFSDGPKANASQDTLENIKRVKEYIHTIHGFKDVIIEDFHVNQGLAPITIYGMGKIFDQYEAAIMMEDDDVPSPYFLSFQNRCLQKFANDKRIWCVSGYIDNIYVPARDGDDLFLVRRPSSWGFGTWRRCWSKVIWDIDTLKGIFKHKDIVRGFDHWCGVDSSGIMINTFSNLANSWSVRYNFAAYLNEAYTILPNKSLILSIGMDGSGTHGSNDGHVATMMDREVIIPDEIKFDAARDRQLSQTFKSIRFRSKIKAYVKKHPHVRKLVYKLLNK